MTATRQPIAVVGVSALFPGSTDERGFWRDILAGKDLITDVPAGHWLIEDYYDPDPSAPDKTYARRGGFLPPVDFDALAWGVPPSIVPATDTAQLLALIVAQRVLEDAARGRALDKRKMSVVLGVTSAQELLGTMVSRLQRPVWQNALRQAGLPEDKVQEACQKISDHYVPWQESTFPGLLGNVVAGRIANRLDLGGTNCVTDAACASTFSALHMAVNELHLGDSDAVVCGGVDTMNDIFMYMCFSKTPALSRSGDVRPFSDKADGTMLGEGLGMVLLKRLADAERDGDHIYAVISGVGSSSDGRSKSVYAPVSAGQAWALRRAYEHAGIRAADIDLIEAHGTGTRAGDAAEFGGLRAVFEESGRPEAQWCALGTVKSQIGHAKAAAGAAGLFKAIMAVQHGVLPPTIKIDQPDPKLSIETSPFYLNTRARPWVRGDDQPRRAGVSSFGFGGSNFHVVVEEYRGPGAKAGRLDTRGHHLVVLEAGSPDALIAEAQALATQASTTPGTLLWASAQRCAAATGAGSHRLAVIAESDADLAKKLAAAAELVRGAPDKASSKLDGVHYGIGAAEGAVGLLFPGQGSQYLDMGAGLAIAAPEARAAWDAAATLGLDLHRKAYPNPAFSAAEEDAQLRALTATEVAQPAIGAASLAALRALRGLGLGFSAVAGHSFGELTALHAAGALDEADFLRASAARGAAMAAAAASTAGAMTAAAASVEAVREVIEKNALDVVVANHNHPSQVVLSGATPAVEAAEGALKAAGITAQRLTVSTAFHSTIVAGATTEFGAALSGLRFAAPTLPVFADATAAPYAAEAEAVRAQLAQQLAEPVRFVEVVEAMYAAGVRTFVEVGPSNVLTGLVGRILKGKPHTALCTDKKKRDGWLSLLDAVGKLWAEGRPLQLGALRAGLRDPADPADKKALKHAIAINGTNIGKPYPPKDGAAGRAQPNPPTPPAPPAAAAPAPRAAAPTPPVAARPVPAAPSAPVSPPAAARPAPVSPAPASPAPLAQNRTPDVISAAPAAAQVKMSSSHRPDPAAVSAWITAWQDTQRQTAEAHSAFSRAMADSHAAFLRTAEVGMSSLAALVSGGAPVDAGLRLPAAAPALALAAPVAAPAPVLA
ncbi:MAG: hypothetical protein RL071_4775, partial [Pseudomonadota bacterium]